MAVVFRLTVVPIHSGDCRTTDSALPVFMHAQPNDYVSSSKVRSFSAKSHPKNAGKRICGTLDFKIFRGSMPPDPPRIARAFGARIPPPETMTLATPLQIDFTNMLFHAAIELIRVTGGK